MVEQLNGCQDVTCSIVSVHYCNISYSNLTSLKPASGKDQQQYTLNLLQFLYSLWPQIVPLITCNFPPPGWQRMLSSAEAVQCHFCCGFRSSSQYARTDCAGMACLCLPIPDPTALYLTSPIPHSITIKFDTACSHNMSGNSDRLTNTMLTNLRVKKGFNVLLQLLVSIATPAPNL